MNDIKRPRILQQEPGCPGGNRGDHTFLVAEDGDNHDLHVGTLFSRQPDQIKAMAIRQFKVRNEDGRLV